MLCRDTALMKDTDLLPLGSFKMTPGGLVSTDLEGSQSANKLESLLQLPKALSETILASRDLQIPLHFYLQNPS